MKKLLFLIILVFVISGTAYADDSINYVANTLSSAGGRFVFGQTSFPRKDQYMLDTETGRLWQIVLNEDKQPVLQVVPYVLGNGKYGSSPPEEYEKDLLKEESNAE